MRRAFNDGGWVALVFLVMGLGFGGWGVISAVQSARFERDGITVLAEVIDRRESRRRSSQGRSRTSHYVAVSYLAPGESDHRTAEQQVRENFHDTTRVGAQIPIRILPDAPDRIQIDPGRLRRTAWIAGPVGLLMGAFGLWMAARVRQSIARADRLAQAGVATVGRVIRVATRKKSVTLHWTYQPPVGVPQQITTSIPAASPLADLAPGAEFPARFDPDDPGNAAPADAALAR